jgi:hypothetical protein
MKDGRSLEHNHETPDDFDLELARTVLIEQRIRKLEQAFGTDKDLVKTIEIVIFPFLLFSVLIGNTGW